MLDFLSSPKNYNESLKLLNKATFLATLVFYIFLCFFSLIPQIKIPKELIPPIDGHEKLVQWILSFGVTPLAAASLAFFASYAFELHNKVAWLVGVRPFWSKHFILGPLKEKAHSSVPLTIENAKLIMNELYYPEIKKIDQHHVHLFWRYTTQFWILFEHLIIVFFTSFILSAFQWRSRVAFLWLYFITLCSLTALHFFFIAGPKSTKQANEIPYRDVHKFFITNFPEYTK